MKCPKCGRIMKWRGLDDYSEGEYYCKFCGYVVDTTEVKRI